MIKHNAANSVISPYNPIISLKPKMRKLVNEDYIMPIVLSFFGDDIDNHEPLNIDDLTTDIEFIQEDNKDESYIKTYIYKKIIDKASKSPNSNRVHFKPKYAITFDKQLGDVYYARECYYPNTRNEIRYGELRFGEIPILYYIFIPLQDLIEFIKSKRVVEDTEVVTAKTETNEIRRNRLIDNSIEDKKIKLKYVNESEKELIKTEINHLENLKKEQLQGKNGALRVNLSWYTTDDLDLHIITPEGTINYQNKKQGLGELDVDANAGGHLIANPQENVYWASMPQGEHTIVVNFFKSNEKHEVKFDIFVLSDIAEGEHYEWHVDSEGVNKRVGIVTFEFKDNKLYFTHLIPILEPN